MTNGNKESKTFGGKWIQVVVTVGKRGHDKSK